MDPITLSALIMGGSSLLGGIGNLFGSKASDNRYAAQSLAAQRLANKHNVKFWNMQNEYNHPSAQMSRLREAGLNPHMLYGQGVSGATGAAGAIAPSKKHDTRASNHIQAALSGLGGMADAGVRLAQVGNFQAQNNNLASQTAYNWRNAKRLQTMTPLEAQLAQGNIRLQNANIFRQELENGTMSLTQRARISKIFSEAQMAGEILNGQKLTNYAKSLEIKLKQNGLSWNDPLMLRILVQNPEKAKEIAKALPKHGKAILDYAKQLVPEVFDMGNKAITIQKKKARLNYLNWLMSQGHKLTKEQRGEGRDIILWLGKNDRTNEHYKDMQKKE
jgi:hypothetical protein